MTAAAEMNTTSLSTWLVPSNLTGYNGKDFDTESMQVRVNALPPRAKITLRNKYDQNRRDDGRRKAEHEALDDLRERRKQALSDSASLEKEIERGGMKRTEETDAEFARLDELAAQCKVEYEALFNRPNLNTLLVPCLEAVERYKPGQLIDAGFTATLPKGKSVQEAIDELKAQVAAVEAKRKATIGKKLPLDEAIARAHADIDDRAATNPPQFGGLFNLKKRGVRDRLTQGSIRWPIDWEKENIDMVSMFFWFHADQLKERATAELTAMFDPADSIDTNTRRELIAQYDAEIEALDYQAGAIGELTRDYVTFRPGISPLAVLGVKVAD